MPKTRDHGEGGLYELKSRGLWRGVIDVGFKPDGTRKQKYVHAKTKTEARDRLRAMKKEIEQFGAPLDRTMTVARWADHWLTNICARQMKPRPLSSYESIVRTWIVPTIGKKRMAQVLPSDLRRVTKAVLDAGRAESTARKVHSVMTSMLEDARRDNVIGRNVGRDVIAPGVGGGERGALPTETAFRLLKAAARHTDGTRWWFAILTGMRQGERLGATLDSIDFDSHQFTVQWSLTEAKFDHGCGGDCGLSRGGACPQRRLRLADGLTHQQLDGRLVLVRPKSKKTRTFPLIPQLELALKRYLAATADVPNPHGLIWRNPDGSPITAGQDSDAWRAILLEAGVISIEQAKPSGQRAKGTEATPTTHWARHTTATVLMELNVPARVIGEIVGHASEKVTRGYQHVSSTAAREAFELMGEHFKGALED